MREVAIAPSLIRQRTDDDCTICSIAMATGLPYERVIEAASAAKLGYKPGFGTRSTYWVLRELGFESRVLFALDAAHAKPGLVFDPQGLLKTSLWGRRAIVSLPSLNDWKGDHDLYWDGRAIHDPSTKPNRYPAGALETVPPIEAVIFDEISA